MAKKLERLRMRAKDLRTLGPQSRAAADDAEAKALAIAEVLRRAGVELVESPAGISWRRFR